MAIVINIHDDKTFTKKNLVFYFRSCLVHRRETAQIACPKPTAGQVSVFYLVVNKGERN